MSRKNVIVSLGHSFYLLIYFCCYVLNEIQCIFYLIGRSYIIVVLIFSAYHNIPVSFLSVSLTQLISKIALLLIVRMALIVFWRCLLEVYVIMSRATRYSVDFLQKVALTVQPDQCSAKVHGLRNS